MDVKRVGGRIERNIPDALVNPLTSQHLPRIAEEEAEYREFLGGQVEWPASPLAALGHRVDGDIAINQEKIRGLLSTTHQRPDARQQLRERERLAKIIIRSVVETGDPVRDLVPRGQEDNRSLAHGLTKPRE